MLEESGVELLAYDAQFRQYRVRINPTLDDKQRQTLSALAHQARAGFGKAA
jgi:hypothetical protein